MANFNIANNCPNVIFYHLSGIIIWLVATLRKCTKQNLANVLQASIVTCEYLTIASVSKNCALQGVPTSSVSIVLTIVIHSGYKYPLSSNSSKWVCIMQYFTFFSFLEEMTHIINYWGFLTDI